MHQFLALVGYDADRSMSSVAPDDEASIGAALRSDVAMFMHAYRASERDSGSSAAGRPVD